MFAGGISSLAHGAQVGCGLFAQNSSTMLGSNSFMSDKIPQSLRTIKPLSENLNPIVEEGRFAGEDDDDVFRRSKPPFCGFDQDSVIVPKTKQRQIPKIPFKVLDAPALKDDYYLNLVDWSE